MIEEPQNIEQQEAVDSLRESDVRSNMFEMTRDLEREAFDKLESFEFKQNQFFRPWRRIFRENVDYFNSHQWTSNDAIGLLQQNRKPYVFNQIRPYVEVALGEQRIMRMDPRATPQNPIAEHYAGKMNHYLRWVTQKNQWPDTASDIFRDGFVGGVGVAGVSLDYNDPFANVTLERCYPLEFMWDIETAKNSTLDGTEWLWHGKWTSIGSALDEYPDYADIIRGAAGGAGSDRQFTGYDVLRRPRINAPVGELHLDYQYTGLDYFTRDMVFRRELYHRRYERRWVVRDGISGMVLDYETEYQAQQGVEQLFALYTNPQVAQTFGVSKPLISEPRIVNRPFVDKYVFFGTRLVDFRTGQGDRFPYKFFIPEFYDGELTSRIEHVKPLNRFVNRIMMFLDEIAGGVKGGTIINGDYLDDSITDTDIRRMAVQTNPVWIVRKPPEDFPLEQFSKTTAAPINGQMAGELLGAIKDNIFGLTGGPNSQGLAAFAGQSGVSAQEMRSAASIRNIPVFDKWRFFNQQVFEDAVALSGYLEPTVKMYVTNEYGEPEIMSFIEQAFDEVFTPGELEYGITITEVMATQSEQEAMRGELAMIMQTAPDTYPVVLPKYLKTTNMDPRDRRDIEVYLQEQAAFSSQMQEREMRLQEQERMWKMEESRIKLQLKDKELDLMARGQIIPKVNITGKIGEMPPAEEATLLSATGNPDLEADPLGIMQDRAIHTVMQQERSDLEQSHANALTPPWQKEKGAKAPKGTATPKDKRQRRNR